MCVHTLVLPYLLTLLLTSGHLSQHLVIELSNRWKHESDTLIGKESLVKLRAMVENLIVSTGEYDTVASNKTTLKELLSKYLVSTEKQKTSAMTYPDAKLLGPIRKIPLTARQSTRKRALLLATNCLGYKYRENKTKKHKAGSGNLATKSSPLKEEQKVGIKPQLIDIEQLLQKENRKDLQKRANKIIDLCDSDDEIEQTNDMKKVKISKKRNRPKYYETDVQKFGNIVDVLGDGNCGFYVIKSMLIKLGKVDVGASVTSIRKLLYQYIEKNTAIIMKNINVSFRNNLLRGSRLQQYIKLEVERIYGQNVNFEHGCDSEHWMEACFDVVVASLAFGVPFGYYNLSLGWSSFIELKSSTVLDVQTFDEILLPPHGCQMIIYNGTNHFKYLNQTISNEQTSNVRSKDIMLPDDLDMKKVMSPRIMMQT